jgi:hypothetical protein
MNATKIVALLRKVDSKAQKGEVIYFDNKKVVGVFNNENTVKQVIHRPHLRFHKGAIPEFTDAQLLDMVTLRQKGK